MTRFLIAGIAALGTLAATPVLADRGGYGPNEVRCRQDGGCPAAERHGRGRGHGRDDWRHEGRHEQWRDDDWRRDDWRRDRRDARYHDDGRVVIHIGSDGSRGDRWRYRNGYGFGPAPYGREYRVIDGRLVMVDSQTLQVVAVLGLLSALLN